jgi:UDP-2,3-diacylglucosamine pyrophosphatase LpxH
VISDTHLGDRLSTVDGKTGEILRSAVAELGELDQVILLGDIFDFWQSPVEDSLERGREAISGLFTLENVKRIVYVPGNHDHHVCRMYIMEETARRLREGNLEPASRSRWSTSAR